jgi:branched-chain amino acid transport system ATP-binding protein
MNKKGTRGETDKGMEMLQVTNLRKRFGGVQAVDDISFHVDYGETISVIGPNGAGKTTVFNLITGFYRPDGGSILFQGREITRMAPYRLPRLGVGRTFQNMRLFGDLTVFENLLSGMLRKSGYNVFSTVFRTSHYFEAESKAEEKVRELIDFFGLAGKEDLATGSLPYGEQRKLELARALSIGPKLLLIDEPGAGMNPKEIQDLVETIRMVKERFSLTLLIIEHQMGLVMSLSDRVIVMDFGEKIMEGRPEEVRGDKRVIEAYLGSDEQ